MSENEKMELSEEQTSTCSEQTCAETSSPAMNLAEAAEAAAEAESENEICGETHDARTPGEDSLAAARSEALELDEAAELSHIQEIHRLSKEELVERLRKILADDDMEAHRDVTVMKQSFFNIRKRETDAEAEAFVAAGNGIDAFAPTPCPLENDFKDLLAEFKTRRTRYLEKDEEERQANLAEKLRLIDAIRTLSEDVDNINRNYNEFQRLQQEFKDIKKIPPQADAEVWKQFQGVVEQFYDLLKLNKELRDLDFRKNLETKRGLLEEARRLGTESDVVAASRRLQELHAEWRETGPVAKDIREEIWNEFREASAIVNRRMQDFFMQRKVDEQKNGEAKTALCERMEALRYDGFTKGAEWEKATDEVKALQTEWKKLGFASRKLNNALFSRFRKAIDAFFSAKSDYYTALRETYKVNLAKKNELCERAEAMAEGDITAATLRILKDLQEEWKTVGVVERRQGEAVWLRFNRACKTIFDRRHKENNARISQEKANLEVKNRIVADLRALGESGRDDDEAREQYSALQEEWRNVGHVPFAKKEELNDAYYALVRELGDRLGVRRFAPRRDDRRRDDRRSSAPLGARDLLEEKIQRKKSALQTYENNMGFFNVKSAAGNSMLAELQLKIENIRKEIAELEAKRNAPEE